MAVQAQHPSYAFSTDTCNRPWDNAGEELQALQRNLLVGSAFVFDCGKSAAGAVLSDLQWSELTCNKFVLKKRARDVLSSMALPHTNGDSARRMNADKDSSLCLPGGVSPNRFMDQNAASASAATLFPMNHAVRSLIFSDDVSAHGVGLQSRKVDSAGASTSGRLAFPSSEPHAVTPLAHYLFSHFRQQSLEIDVLIRLQFEKLLSGLAEARKRHCQALLTAVEQQTLKRLTEKEAELEAAKRRKAELEEKLLEASTEIHFWSKVAKNNASMVSNLSSKLEQALQNVAANSKPGARDPSPAKEGFGEFDGAHFLGDDARSCCFSGHGDPAVGSEAAYRPLSCKACGERDACVILLPCRHLCLCRVCESMAVSCPVCKVAKNASLDVFMS